MPGPNALAWVDVFSTTKMAMRANCYAALPLYLLAYTADTLPDGS